MQHIQLGGGVERQGRSLVEALPGQHPLDLEDALLLAVQAAVGDGSRLKEGGDDVAVAVLPDDLLGQVGVALHVLAVEGDADVPHAGRVHLHGELQPGQDVDHGLVGHADAQHGADLVRGGVDDLAGGGAAVGAVEGKGGDVAAVQLLDQVQRAGQAQAGRAEIDPLLVPGGGIARLPQGAAGLADRVAGKGGALEQQAVGLVVHARVGAAHHAGQGHRLFGVADDEVVFGQGELLLVQGDDLFAGAGAADVDAAAGHLVQVKGVHGLAHLQQGVVGDVHHVADGAQAAQGQVALHPAGALPHADVAHVVGHVAGAQVGGLHRHGDGRVRLADRLVAGGGHVQGLVQHGGHLPGDAQDGLAVGAVGGDGDVKDGIIQTDDGADVRAGDGVLRQDQQAIDVCAGVQVIVQAQLLPRAEHTVGFKALHHPLFDLDAAGQGRAVQRGGDVRPHKDVGRAGGDADVVAICAAVDDAAAQVGALLLFNGGDDAHHHLVDAGGQLDPLLHLKAAGEELFLQFLGRNVDVYQLFQPAERYFHSAFSSLLFVELPKEPQVVLKHQADVVDAVLEHGDPLDADAEGDARVDLGVDVAVAQHLLVDDAAAQNFDPAGVLAEAAALAVAFKAADVHLDAGLGEGEVGRAQAGAHLAAEQPLDEHVQHALQVAQGDALVHHKALHLVEHGAVGGVRVGAEHPAGHQHLDGGLFGVHGADLAGGGLGAQQQLVGQVEGVLHIPGGMVLGHVQAGKAVVVVLDLGALVNFKAHARKGVDDLVAHQRQRVQPAGGAGLGRQGDVHRLGRVAGGQLGLPHPDGGCVVVGLHLLLQLVDGLAHGGALGRVDGAQLFHQGGHLPVFAQVLLPEGRQRLLGGHLRKVGLGLPGQLFHDFLHHFPLLLSFRCLAFRDGTEKSPVPRPANASQGTEPCQILRGTTQIPRRVRKLRGTLCL